MKTRALSTVLLFSVSSFISGAAQVSNPLSAYRSAMESELIQTKDYQQSFTNDTVLYPFKTDHILTSLTVNGDLQMFSKKSFLRITLIDSNGTEYLVYESNYLICDTLSSAFQNAFEETGFLDNITPVCIKIQIHKSKLGNFKINFTEDLTDKNSKLSELKQDIANYKQEQKIAQINKRIKDLNQKWIAGETSISKLSYAEKKKRFGDSVPNLMGFEYYKGGLFEILDDSKSNSIKLRSATPQFVDNFDWRNRHGINWNTPVKMQFASTCWAFSAVAATEALVNLYFNRKIDYDLSEGEIVSCNGKGKDCNGGRIDIALDYIINSGIVIQDSFPNNCNTQCSKKNPNQAERIKIDGYNEFFLGEDAEAMVKKSIINYGVLSSRINSWQHAMALSGFSTIKVGDTLFQNSLTKIVINSNDTNLIGKTYWIFKGSNGLEWGDGGYCYIRIPDVNNELRFTASLTTPVFSLLYTSKSIVCDDKDNDGCYYWGIGNRPSYVPNYVVKDGDDSNPNLGPMDIYGNIDTLTSPVVYSPTTINTHKWYYYDTHLFGNLNIESNGHLEIIGNVFFPRNGQITIKNGGKITVRENGLINNANIKVEAGGTLILQGSQSVNAILEKGPNDEIVIENGAIFECMYGEIKQIN